MAIPTLYDMCQSQTIVNMRAGLWSQCQENPFTRVPPKLVDKLREFIFSLNFRQLPNREALHLLFTSHRLKKLDLSCFFVDTGETFSESDPYAPSHLKMDIDKKKKKSSMGFYYCDILPDGSDVYSRTKKHMEDECNSLLYMLSKDPQPDLQSFVMTEATNVSKFALQLLIQVSTHLTEIHTCLNWFDLNFLMNYKTLRILRLHDKTLPRNCSTEFLEACEKVLPSLENLETFTICNSRIDCFGIRPLIAIALAHCPKLTSVGSLDSAMAIDFVKSKLDESHTGCLRLKTCFWGFEGNCQSFLRRREMLNLKSIFPELINTAVSRCPFVEELILQVLHKDCLQHLRRLKRLSFLCLDYEYCEDFDLVECFSSLGEIRHQLKHFLIKRNDSMGAYHKFPLNVVIDNCENLETLGVLELSAIDLPLETNTRFRRLKRICISMTSDYLGQILRYCDDLTYLVIVGEFRVDESELQENLSHVSALKLQTLGVRSPYFTRNAMRMVFEKAPNLERVCFSLRMESGQTLLRELGRSIFFYDELLIENCFPPELQRCIF
ncbi:uncharacterized protein CDAR_104461 [Caerostris darwini]|uniref:Uncharacterized protein n=1 Tax=Caerostris darwini TaxID=1538125 RepID=A0AAV4PTN6_9ARAC|nr:uncharacterized protein CDAR_104461 [Caerostris darwini]